MTDRHISVVATGESTIAPDVAIVTLSVSGKGRELASTRQDVNTRTSSVLARLREIGMKKGDLVAPDVSIQPEYDYRRDAQRLVGYRVARSVTARVRDLGMLGQVIDGGVAAGANEMHGVQMSASDPSAAEHEALLVAVAAARAKAQAVADAAGVSLGAVLRVEEEPEAGGLPTPRFRMAAMAESADAPTEVAAGEVTITRRVRAWFVIT